jgi:SAGA-associated factor 29
MSSPDFAGILEHSKHLDRLRKDQEEVLIEINKMHKKLQASESLFNSLTQKEENPE